MSFGKKIKKLREERGLTQAELAALLGTTVKTISNYESKNVRPRKMENYEKLASILGVDMNQLLTEEEYFVLEAGKNFGYHGAAGAEQLVQSMAGLFAGGSLPEEDKDAVFAAIQEAYWQAKLENKKYGKTKNDK